uniref:Uncharacterized protein n=1 Tax=Anguilla anguilla TaxID=7936 RepID=A0A0E9U3Q5_ANGAN
MFHSLSSRLCDHPRCLITSYSSNGKILKLTDKNTP